MANLETLQVRKKGGDTEPFDRNKVLSGVRKSGTSEDHTEQVTAGVESWAVSLPDDVVDSMDIRKKVLELLRGVDPSAASAFESYRKPH